MGGTGALVGSYDLPVIFVQYVRPRAELPLSFLFLACFGIQSPSFFARRWVKVVSLVFFFFFLTRGQK